jgi:hypothetical protein
VIACIDEIFLSYLYQVCGWRLLALDQVLENLVMFYHFWDFDRLVEDEAPGEAEIAESRPLLWDFWV